MAIDANTLDRALDRIARRMWMGRVLRALVMALLVLLSLAALAMIAVRPAWPGWKAAAIAMGGLAAAGVIFALWRARRVQTRFDAAAAADSDAKLKERLATWVALRENGPGSSVPEGIRAAQAADALAAAEDAPLEQVAPVRVPDRVRWLVLPAAVLAAVWLLDPKSLDLPRAWTFAPGAGSGTAEQADEQLDAPEALAAQARATAADPDRPDRPSREQRHATERARAAKASARLTSAERAHILELMRQHRIAAEARGAGRNEAAREAQELEFVRTVGADGAEYSGSVEAAEAVWRWAYPAYVEEIARYMGAAGPG